MGDFGFHFGDINASRTERNEKNENDKKFEFDFGSNTESEPKKNKNYEKKPSIQDKLDENRFSFQNKFDFKFETDFEPKNEVAKNEIQPFSQQKQENLNAKAAFVNETQDSKSKKEPEKPKLNPYPSLSASLQESNTARNIESMRKEQAKDNDSSFKPKSFADSENFIKKSEDLAANTEPSKKDDFLAFSHNFGESNLDDKIKKETTETKKDFGSGSDSNTNKITFSGVEKAFKIQRQDSLQSQQQLNFEDFVDINPDDFKTNFNFDFSEKESSHSNTENNENNVLKESVPIFKVGEDQILPLKAQEKYPMDLNFNFEGTEKSPAEKSKENDFFDFKVAEEKLRNEISGNTGFELPDNAFHSMDSFKEAFDFGFRSRGIGETDFRKSEFLQTNRQEVSEKFDTVQAFSETVIKDAESLTATRNPTNEQFQDFMPIKIDVTRKQNEGNNDDYHFDRSPSKSKGVILNEPVNDAQQIEFRNQKKGNDNLLEFSEPFGDPQAEPSSAKDIFDFEIRNEVLILKGLDSPRKKSSEDNLPSTNLYETLKDPEPPKPKNFERYQVQSIQEVEEIGDYSHNETKTTPKSKRKDNNRKKNYASSDEKFYEEIVQKSINDAVYLLGVLEPSLQRKPHEYQTIFKRGNSQLTYSPSKDKNSIVNCAIRSLPQKELTKLAKSLLISLEKNDNIVNLHGKKIIEPPAEIFHSIFSLFEDDEENLDNFRYCCLFEKGILYENNDLTIAFTAFRGIEAPNGQMMYTYQLIIGNKTQKEVEFKMEMESTPAFIHYENDLKGSHLLKPNKGLQFFIEFSTDSIAPLVPGQILIKYNFDSKAKDICLALPFLSFRVLNSLFTSPEVLILKWQRLKKSQKISSRICQQNQNLLPSSSNISKYFEFLTEKSISKYFSKKLKEFQVLIGFRNENAVIQFSFYLNDQLKISGVSTSEPLLTNIMKTLVFLFCD